MFVRTGFFGGVALCFSLSDRSCDIRKVGADGKTFVKQVRRADSHLGKPSFSLKREETVLPLVPAISSSSVMAYPTLLTGAKKRLHTSGG